MAERDAIEILRDLVAIPSVSSRSNRPVIDYALAILKDAGWRCEEWSYDDAKGVTKWNLVALSPGTRRGETVDLAFACHTDTVPFAPGWLEATTLREVGENLHGCGACDVKGALAGILSAIAHAGRPAGSRALVLTSDEEIGCVGAQFLLEARAFAARRLVVCEPTGLRPATAGKGYGLARVRVQGKEAHSAFPEQGESAISAAAMLMQAIEEWACTREGLRNELFDPPRTTVNVGLVQGGTAKNIVAGECWFLVEWRPLPGEDGGEFAEELRRLIAAAMVRRPRCSVEVEILRADRGFATMRPLAGSLLQAIGQFADVQATGIPFGSEAQRFASVCDEVIVMGPGDMRSAHSDRECVAKGELALWTAWVGRLLTRTDV